jgi:5-methylcytosine-specific restriction endonuclease McrA
MSHALVLNATFEPLQIVSWQKAIQLLFQGKVEVIEESDREVRTVTLTFRVPAVLRLLEYVPLKRKRQLVRFSRTNVFVRDRHQCQYCGELFTKTHLTLDHVIPVVQNGSKTWENIVTACKPCNQRKGGRTPQQAKMELIKKPRAPQWLPNLTLSLSLSKRNDPLHEDQPFENSSKRRSEEKWKVYLKLDSRDDEPEE